MSGLKLGVLGVSRHFIMRVLPALQKSSVIEVAGIASRDAAKARDAALHYQIPQSYGSYEALLQDPAVEAVYIPLPNDSHIQWLKKAADYGKAVICEKPLAMNAAEAADALAYVNSKGVPAMEAFMYRFHPQWRRVTELVGNGEIGQIRAIHTFYGYHNSDPKNIRNIKANGGGALYDIGCYAVSAARFIMNSEPRRVLAVMELDPEFATDSLTQVILDFGAARTFFTVSTQIFPHQKVTVYGTAGLIEVAIPFNMPADVPAQVTVQTSVTTRVVELGPADQYQILFDSFAQAVRQGLPVPTPLEDAVANMKTLDAIFKSAQSGQWEPVI
jgi:predicted dehydrogenase